MKFYSMQIGFMKDEFFVKPGNSAMDFYSLFKGTEMMVPQTFVQAGGTVKYDLIGTGFAGLYLISERIESILKSNGITGWETFRVNVFDNENKRINGYFGFSIKGRCGI